MFVETSFLKLKVSKNEFEEILNICEGYPFFANTILNHIIEKSKTISLELEENEFKDGIIKRLIAGVEPFPNFSSSDLYNVAKGIAVFKNYPLLMMNMKNLALLKKNQNMTKY